MTLCNQYHFFLLTSILCCYVLSEYPPIINEQERLEYKKEFDRDHMEYKRLQAELDDINQGLADTDRELDSLQEGSPQYMVCNL